MKFTDKVVFIISHENWGQMLVSKHHYAIELGKAGNKVYFINHPDKRKELTRGEIKVIPTGHTNVCVVLHRLFHPYFLKFKLKWFYNFLTSLHITRIIKAVGTYPDIVWSFDTGNTFPLKYFPKSDFRILMPVDGPFDHEDERKSSEKADAIISVTEKILNIYSGLEVPKLKINHGVSDVFLKSSPNEVKSDGRIRIGYSGSLLRSDLDTRSFLEIIRAHSDKIFEFWGEHDHKRSNIHLPQDVTRSTLGFIDKLRNLHNVILHGPVDPETLAAGLRRMDAFLVCYNSKDSQNSHKVLEYLATGKVIISSYMSSYEKEQGLIEMITDNSEEGLPKLFDRVVNNLPYFNSSDLSRKRRAFAAQFSYSNNVERISNFIQKAKPL